MVCRVLCRGGGMGVWDGKQRTNAGGRALPDARPVVSRRDARPVAWVQGWVGWGGWVEARKKGGQRRMISSFVPHSRAAGPLAKGLANPNRSR